MNPKQTTSSQKPAQGTTSPRKKLVSPHTQTPTNKSKPSAQTPSNQTSATPKKALTRNMTAKNPQALTQDVHSKSNTAKKPEKPSTATHHKRSTSDAQLKLQLSKDKSTPKTEKEKAFIPNTSSRFGQQEKLETSKGFSDPYNIYQKVLSEASPSICVQTTKNCATSTTQPDLPDNTPSPGLGRVSLKFSDNSAMTPKASATVSTPLKDVFFSENKNRFSVYQKRFDALKSQPSQNGAATPMTPKTKVQTQADCTPRTPAKAFYKKDNPYHIPKINEKKFSQKVDEVSSTIRKIYRDHKRGLSVGQVYNFANDSDEKEGRKSTKEESILLNKSPPGMNFQGDDSDKEDLKEEETMNVPEKPALVLGLENYHQYFEVGKKTFEFDSMFENNPNDEKGVKENNIGKENLLKSPAEFADKEKEDEDKLNGQNLLGVPENEQELTLELSKLQRSMTYDATTMGRRASGKKGQSKGMEHWDLARILDLITSEEEDGFKGI